MKEIIISEDKQTTSDIIGTLCNINLMNDVVICSPYWEQHNDDILYDIDQFDLYNRNNIKIDKSNNYIFYPRIKAMLPEGLVFHFESKIPGLEILNNRIDKFKGIQLSSTLPLTDFSINLNAVEGVYNLYYRFEFILREFSRDLLIKSNETFGSVSRIPLHTNIISFTLLESFIGNRKRDLGEVYLIRSDLLYENFPNFG